MPEGPIQVALKEWNVLCRALEAGEQIFLLRKGGISESIGGFEIEHRQFLFFPTFLHQNPAMLKPKRREPIQPQEAEPETVEIRCAAEITDIVAVKDRAQIGRLDDHHIWSPALIDMRFSYKPQNPLYLLIVRAYRLPQPLTILNTPAFAGCKSWVPLDSSIDIRGVTPAIDSEAFDSKRQSILNAL